MIRPTGPLLAVVGTAIAFASGTADAQFVPPAGYSDGNRHPRMAEPADSATPRLQRLSDVAMSHLVEPDATYRRGTAKAHAKVVGAFAVVDPHKARIAAAWSLGYLPVTLSFEGARCYSFAADYLNGTLSNGRLDQAGCTGQRAIDDPAPPPPPADVHLRFVGTAWGYGAWADDQAGTTIVTAPGATSFHPLFSVRMTKPVAIMAMNGPDWPGGNVTLVGTMLGTPTILTLETGF